MPRRTRTQLVGRRERRDQQAREEQIAALERSLHTQWRCRSHDPSRDLTSPGLPTTSTIRRSRAA